MNLLLNTILSIIILIVLFITKIIIKRKNKNIYKDLLFTKINKLTIFLYMISFLLFVIVFFINLSDPLKPSFLIIIYNALSLAIITLPLSLNTLYYLSFKDEEKYSHTTTIVTNIFDKKLIKKFNLAGINVIILTKKLIDSKIKTIEENELNEKLLNKNLIIKTNKKNIFNKYNNQDKIYYEFEDLNKAYELIKHSRGVHDNYIRTIKYLITTTIPLIICYFTFIIGGFPPIYNLLLVTLFKLYTFITSMIVYRKMPYDVDIMTREPKPKDIVIGFQELLITIIVAFVYTFALSIPYTFTLSQGSSENLANTIFFTIFIYANIFITCSYLSENNIIKNIFKSLKNIYLVLYILFSIGLSLIFIFTKIFTTCNIEIQNYLSSILFALAPMLIYEITKFARYTSIKRRHKNVKNN